MDDGQVDYLALFRDLRKLKPAARTFFTSNKVVAIPSLTVYKSRTVRLQAYEGPTDVQPLIYDADDGTERPAPVNKSEVVATKTHALFDLETREAIIEYNHRGAKAQDIAAVLGAAGRRLPRWRGLYIELNPKIDRAFVEELNRFDRIRLASIRLARPNVDWSDFSDKFTDFAADSDAQTGQVEMNARRGQSLSKTDGLVPAIREVAQADDSIVKNAVVRGVRQGEEAETSLTLHDHKAHQKVSARLDEHGHARDEDIEKKMRAFSRARRALRRRSQKR
ncbi:MAG: hypothetical protein QOE65_2875 [Solirubrobacteraceae bacterium]|jgi:hypothetical protein|nr:hypothetical protein [Solirubrobacteraceae bacterium]